MTLLEKLDIKLPIIQAPMAGVSTPAMAAAVSNAGALGSLGVGPVSAPVARDMILQTRSLTARSININVFCHHPVVGQDPREADWLFRLEPHFAQFNRFPPSELRILYPSFIENNDMLEMLLELRPKVVSFHFGLPAKPTIDALREAEIVLLATATNLEEGTRIESAGIDAVVAQGYEAGGHRGTFDEDDQDDCLGTVALVRLLVSKLNTPVIAAGGIMDGASIAACLSLGAQAAQLGTAFINCPESSADEHYRAALQSDSAYHTRMTRAISGRPARCLENVFTAIGDGLDASLVPEYPYAYDAAKALHALAKEFGVGSYGAHWAGQGAPLARSMPAAELVAQLELEMTQAMNRK